MTGTWPSIDINGIPLAGVAGFRVDLGVHVDIVDDDDTFGQFEGRFHGVGQSLSDTVTDDQAVHDHGNIVFDLLL